jgi:hypothetical protein
MSINRTSRKDKALTWHKVSITSLVLRLLADDPLRVSSCNEISPYYLITITGIVNLFAPE